MSRNEPGPEDRWFALDAKGRRQDPGRPPSRRPSALAVLGAVAVLLVGGIAVANLVHPTHGPPARPATSSSSPTPSTSVTVGPTEAATAQSPPPSAPVVTELGHPLLHATGTWEVLAASPGALTRIEMSRGRVTTTPIPALNSTGPVSFVVGPHQALVVPIDDVPGYVVPDNRPARVTTGMFVGGGPIIPGADASRVWVQRGSEQKPVMSLAGLDGSALPGPSIPVPPDLSPLSAQPDGAGSLIFEGSNGTYDARPDGLHRVTTGQVVAASTRTWLVSDCDDRHRCTTALVDRTTGTRRDIGPGLGPNAALGVVSPDGRLAAVALGPYDSPKLGIYDLATGARRSVSVRLAPAYGATIMAWSPGSRWLLVVTAEQAIAAIDPATGNVTSLGVSLPRVEQLTIRS